MSDLKAQEIISRDSAGRSWLWASLLEAHNEHVVFIGVNGDRHLSRVETFDVFYWKGTHYEVQGYDASEHRWWVEEITPPPETQVRPSGNSIDPRFDSRPGWSTRAA